MHDIQSMNSAELRNEVSSQAESIRLLKLSAESQARLADAMKDEIWNYRQRLEFLEKQMQAMQKDVNVMKMNSGMEYGQHY